MASWPCRRIPPHLWSEPARPLSWFWLVGLLPWRHRTLLRYRPDGATPQSISWESVVAGIRFVRHTKLILATITLDLFAVLLGGATYLLPIYAKDILHVGTTGLGFLRSADAVGACAWPCCLPTCRPCDAPAWPCSGRSPATAWPRSSSASRSGSGSRW